MKFPLERAISKTYVYVRANPDSDNCITNRIYCLSPPPSLEDILCPESVRSSFWEKSFTHSPSTSTGTMRLTGYYLHLKLLSSLENGLQYEDNKYNKSSVLRPTFLINPSI